MYETLGYKQKLENEYNLKVFTDNVEFECLEQTENLLKQEVFKDCKVRLMPDTHAGKGAVIGFTADLGDKVIPNIVGVDIGCFTAETKVWMAGGYYATIKELVDRNEKVLVESYNEELEYFVYNEAIPIKTRENAELIKVQYGSPFCAIQEVRCTLDHKFLVKENNELKWIEAKDLKKDMELFSSSNNVKVMCTELLEEREDVYCLNVSETHNFIINGGIVVHNCGMFCLDFGKIEDKLNLKWLDEGIRKEVPAGRNAFDHSSVKFKDINNLKCFRELKDTGNFSKQIGTLGGGNHFIELDKDDEDNVYLVIHTGSRNMGKQVADYYQNLAVKLLSGYDKFFEEKNNIIKTYKEQGRKQEIQSALKEIDKKMKLEKPKIPNELCYLTDNYKNDYLHDMKICQEYAILNRETIAKNIINNVINPMIEEKLNYNEIDKFQTVHNYINFEDNIIRKGAISAYKGEKVIIPMNMRDGSLICVGKGNPEWNYSAPHGAGRIMSRGKAKENINMEEYVNSMKYIYTTSVNQSTIDEAPMVYKPMQEIIDNIKDTVNIVKIIKPIYNFKASE